MDLHLLRSTLPVLAAFFLAGCGAFIKHECDSSRGVVQSEDTRVFMCVANRNDMFASAKKKYLAGSCTKPGYKFVVDGSNYACVNEQGDIYFEDGQIPVEAPHLRCSKRNRWVHVEKKDAPRSVWIYCDTNPPTAASMTWTISDASSASGIRESQIKNFLYDQLVNNVRDDKINACIGGKYTVSQDRSTVSCELSAPTIEKPTIDQPSTTSE
jgi:hypothetical protein